jgi:hypothetical protein
MLGATFEVTVNSTSSSNGTISEPALIAIILASTFVLLLSLGYVWFYRKKGRGRQLKKVASRDTVESELVTESTQQQDKMLKWLQDMDVYYVGLGYPRGTAYKMMNLPPPDDVGPMYVIFMYFNVSPRSSLMALEDGNRPASSSGMNFINQQLKPLPIENQQPENKQIDSENNEVELQHVKIPRIWSTLFSDC